VSWRWAFLVNVPIGLMMIYLARTNADRNAPRADEARTRPAPILATLACTAAVFGFSMGPEKGWGSTLTIGSGRLAALVLF